MVFIFNYSEAKKFVLQIKIKLTRNNIDADVDDVG